MASRTTLNAQKKVASEGTSPQLSQPQNHLKLGFVFKFSITPSSSDDHKPFLEKMRAMAFPKDTSAILSLAFYFCSSIFLRRENKESFAENKKSSNLLFTANLRLYLYGGGKWNTRRLPKQAKKRYKSNFLRSRIANLAFLSPLAKITVKR